MMYKPLEEQTTTVDIKKLEDGRISLSFSADCGKFGTDELLDEHVFTAEDLLKILQRYDIELTKEEIIKDLDELGNALYNKFGTDSYLERCTIHDLKTKINAF